MSDKKDNFDNYDVELDHNYDGIKELDNPLPMWWVWTFLGTIIFAFVYWLHYSIAGAPGQTAQLEEQLAMMAQQKKAEEALQPQKSSEDLSALASNPTALAEGKKLFQMNCANCHGNEGQGGIGPNLTDKFWIHGDGKIAGVLNTLRVGVLDKGMPAWEAIFKTSEIESLSAFVVSINGTTPANAKAPQGEEKE